MSTYSDAAPLKLPRLVTLFFSFAWGVIAGGVAINAKVKSEQQKDDLERLIPPGATLDLDTSDVNSSGIVITVVSLIIAVLSLIYFILVLLSGHTRADSGSSSRRFHVGSVSHLSSRTLPFQWISLSFLAVWLFAVQTPFTSFFANRSAGVRVFIGTIELQAEVIQVIENELGITPVYRHIDYLRLVAILPWFTILFTAIAAVVSFMASRRRAAGGKV